MCIFCFDFTFYIPTPLPLELEQGVCVRGAHLKPSVWATLFGNFYWNKRRVVTASVEADVEHVHETILDMDEEEEDILEYHFKLVTKVMTKKQLVDVLERGVRVKSVNNEDALHISSYLPDSRLSVCYYEVVVEGDERVKRVRGVPAYESRLLRRLREKFVWHLTPFNEINEACIHHHVIQLMKEDHVRAIDRARIIENGIVSQFFVPAKGDIYAADFRNSKTLASLRGQVFARRVDFNWQRFIGLGLRPQVGTSSH